MVSCAFNGLGLALVIPCVQSLVADYHPSESRGKAFGFMFFTASCGACFACHAHLWALSVCCELIQSQCTLADKHAPTEIHRICSMLLSLRQLATNPFAVRKCGMFQIVHADDECFHKLTVLPGL